jgi:hypothetical protein
MGVIRIHTAQRLKMPHICAFMLDIGMLHVRGNIEVYRGFVRDT